MKRILIVEDNAGIAGTMREHLAQEGYQVEVAGTVAAGLASVRAGPPDLVILDLMLPDATGESLLWTIRAEGITCAVLILSAKSDEMSKVRGFQVGGDDYLTKPFGILELSARVDNLLRRTRHGGPGHPLRFGDVVVDPAARTVHQGEHEVELRPKEFDLLLALLRRPGRVWSRQELLVAVWDYDPVVRSRTVDWHVAELRRKLEVHPAEPRYLQTVRTVGYRFDLDAD